MIDDDKEETDKIREKIENGYRTQYIELPNISPRLAQFVQLIYVMLRTNLILQILKNKNI